MSLGLYLPGRTWKLRTAGYRSRVEFEWPLPECEIASENDGQFDDALEEVEDDAKHNRML